MTTDAELAGLDVAAAIGRGMAADGQARQAMFTDAAIAAAIEAEELGVGPYPVAILARVVRAGGFAEALRLPEPLIGAEPTALARRWLEAALAAGDKAAGDKAAGDKAAGDKTNLVFSHWLEMVATLLAVRVSARSARSARSVRSAANGADPDA